MVVAPIPPESVTQGGIMLPQKYQDDRRRWSVLQVGPDVKEIQPGDKVLTHGNEEPLFEWSDLVRVIDAKAVLMVWK